MTDGTAAAGAYALELDASEVATVAQALRLLLDTLGRDEADQITEIQALLARLPDPAA
jgi:hypothetical protein